MSDDRQGTPGFHALMMAAAYAEEGLFEHASEVLREGVGERRPPRVAGPSRLRAWLHDGAGRPAGRTA